MNWTESPRFAGGPGPVTAYRGSQLLNLTTFHSILGGGSTRRAVSNLRQTGPVAHPMGGMTVRLSRLPSHPAAQGEASRMWTVPCVRSPDRHYRTDARSRRSWPHRPLRSLGHHLSRGRRGTPVPLPLLPESNPCSTQAWSRPYRVPLSRAVRRLISRATSSPCMSPWPSASDSSLSVREWPPSPSTSRSSRERGLAGNSDWGSWVHRGQRGPSGRHRSP